ncbi:uncharacterized protein LOC132731157 isoform X2 [Ruditapes philippinarum]|uniref:uncharacterized protein LOC132731157 isoform X2 n=1 Tax=Ruditapes philippinarum TaxID=129788 RepID=UPI00295B1C6C|nr:uncharacterized protein LOC132731157 isoform X2 [Ruditapes philippinarum]
MATSCSGSDEFINFKCCLCEKKNITKEADTYCVECQDYYCSPCTDLHKMFPSAIGEHHFIDKSSFNTADLQKSLPSFPVEKCEAHKTKLLDMYCADHDDIACATCIAIKHRTCQNIHSVPDEIDTLYQKTEVEDIQQKLLRIKTKMEDTEKAKKLLIKELNAQKEKATESIRQFRRELEEILDTLEMATITTLEEKYKNATEKLEIDINKLQKHFDVLKRSSHKLTKSAGNKAQEFVALKNSRKHINEANEAEAASVTNSSGVKVEFNADLTMINALKDFKTFGFVSVSESENMRDKLYDVKSKKLVNIKHENDRRTCSVYGSCFTDDGLLFLADYSNKALKLIDLSSESIKDRLDLYASPLNICQIGKNEIAVSLINQTIQFVSKGNKLNAIKQQKVDHFCHGLACRDDKLFISDQSTTVYIYDINGSMIRKISTDKQGDAIFSSNSEISVSSVGRMIYVADHWKGLIVLDLEGNYKTTITDPDFVYLQGVCTDKRGNIFVCGWGKSKIVQINENSGTKMGVIGDVCKSRSVSFNSQQNRLVVTIDNSDKIEVYYLA